VLHLRAPAALHPQQVRQPDTQRQALKRGTGGNRPHRYPTDIVHRSLLQCQTKPTQKAGTTFARRGTHPPTKASTGLPIGLPHAGSPQYSPPTAPQATGLPAGLPHPYPCRYGLATHRKPFWIAHHVAPYAYAFLSCGKPPPKFFWVRYPPCPHAHACLYPQKVRPKRTKPNRSGAI